MQYERYPADNSLSQTVVIATQFTRDREYLCDIVRQCRLRSVEATTYREVLSAVGVHGAAALVCDDGLPWRDIVSHLADNCQPPRLIIVTADHDQSLFAEALNRGAYDVLTKPFSAKEAEWVISCACSRSSGEPHISRRPASREQQSHSSLRAANQ
jgi:DNA-binding response OmpR family regulator